MFVRYTRVSGVVQIIVIDVLAKITKSSISIVKEAALRPSLLVTYYKEKGTNGDTYIKIFKATELLGNY